METTHESLLVGYTGGKPYLQLIDVDATRVVSLATPLDGRDYTVDHAYARDGYVVLHSGTDLAVSVPSDLRSGAPRLGFGWSVVPAVDPAFVWLWQPERNRDSSVDARCRRHVSLSTALVWSAGLPGSAATVCGIPKGEQRHDEQHALHRLDGRDRPCAVSD